MNTFKASTGNTKKVELPSSLEQILWTRPCAAAGSRVVLEVFTRFIGNKSNIQIELYDKNAKKFDTIKGKTVGNVFRKEITVPEKAKDELYAVVKLPAHNLCKKSNCLYVYPTVQIKNCKWDKKEARRGDILKLTADILNVYEGTEAEIHIMEHDQDGAHDFITKFPAIVKNKKIAAEWEYEYYEDTDDIPTHEETEKGYNPPEYFFRVIIAGVSADSNLLEFRDFIELELIDSKGRPIANAKYEVLLPDGTELSGSLDSSGKAVIQDVPPGFCWVNYPDFEEAL